VRGDANRREAGQKLKKEKKEGKELSLEKSGGGLLEKRGGRGVKKEIRATPSSGAGRNCGGDEMKVNGNLKREFQRTDRKKGLECKT